MHLSKMFSILILIGFSIMTSNLNSVDCVTGLSSLQSLNDIYSSRARILNQIDLDLNLDLDLATKGNKTKPSLLSLKLKGTREKRATSFPIVTENKFILNGTSFSNHALVYWVGKSVSSVK